MWLAGWILAATCCLSWSVEKTLALSTSEIDKQCPVRVEVSIFIVDVDAIDTASQSFNANVFIEARWHDPGLAHDGAHPVIKPLTEIWHPHLQVVNQRTVSATFPEAAEIDPSGNVLYRQRLWGSFSQPLHLADFPFDRQSFTAHFVAVGYTAGEVELVEGRKTGMAEKLSQADWKVLDWRAEPRAYQPLPGREGPPGFAFTFEAQRKQNYYLLKVILPLILIVMMSWVVFWIDPAETGTDIGVAMTSMLTLIAYRFAVGAFLPVISYMTRLDFFILGSTLLVFFTLVEATATSVLIRRGRKGPAFAVDRVCRWIFPAIFIYITLQTLCLPLPVGG